MSAAVDAMLIEASQASTDHQEKEITAVTSSQIERNISRYCDDKQLLSLDQSPVAAFG